MYVTNQNAAPSIFASGESKYPSLCNSLQVAYACSRISAHSHAVLYLDNILLVCVLVISLFIISLLLDVPQVVPQVVPRPRRHLGQKSLNFRLRPAPIFGKISDRCNKLSSLQAESSTLHLHLQSINKCGFHAEIGSSLEVAEYTLLSPLFRAEYATRELYVSFFYSHWFSFKKAQGGKIFYISTLNSCLIMDKLPCAMVSVWQASAFTSILGIRTSFVGPSRIFRRRILLTNYLTNAKAISGPLVFL